MVTRATSDVDVLAAHCRSISDVEFTVEPAVMIEVIGTLQFALRHPRFRTLPSGRRMRTLVDTLIVAFARGNADVEDLLRRGDDPAWDVVTPAPSPQSPAPNP